MRYKRVVHLNTFASGGSIPGIIQSLHQGSQEFGFSAEVIFGRGQAPGTLKYKRVGGLQRQAWDLLCSRIFDRAGKQSRSATTAALKGLRIDPPELVHIHNLHGYWINQRDILIGLTALNIPVVWTLHDYWPITGHCAYFERAGCEKWQVSCGDCPQSRHYPKSYMDRSVKNFFEKQSNYGSLKNFHLVTVSKHSENLLGKSILAGLPTTTVYNSIDTATFRPVKPAMTFDGKCVVGCVAKIWDERKGLDDIFKVRERLGDSFIFLVVGLTKKQIRSLPSGVVGVPPVTTPEEMAALYSCMDVFFNSSSEETFGMTTVEAMACGVPVVLYDVSATREIQPEFMTHGIVRPHGYNDAAGAIEKIANEVTPDLKESLVNYVADRFSRDVFLNEYYGLYRKILEDSQVSRNRTARHS